MATPNPTSPPEKNSASELRNTLQALAERLDQIEAEITSLRDGLAAAVTQPSPATPAAPGDTIVFEAVSC